MTREEASTDWIDQLERPLALVCGGGASLGAAQVGMARALAEAGVEPDFVVGTSVGALNGSFLARGFDEARVEQLESIWHDLGREDVFPGVGVFRTARALLSGNVQLASSEGLKQLVETNLPGRHEALEIPTTVVASDILSGERVLLGEGDLRTHVRASAAIPLVFEPIRQGDDVWVDGGVTSNVPVLPACRLGAKSMIVLDPGFPCSLEEVPSGVIGFSLHVVTMMLRHQSHAALYFLRDECQVVYPPPPCPVDVPPHVFGRSGELIERSYDQAVDLFANLEIDGPGVYGHPHVHGEGFGNFDV